MSITDKYIIMPVSNGFVLRPSDDLGAYNTLDITYVFETAEKLGGFITENFKALKEEPS